jgi:PilZ domain
MPQLSETSPRRFARRSVELPIKLLVPVDGLAVTGDALVMDLTQVGARVFSNMALAPGQTLRVFPSEGIKYAIPGRVVWSRINEAARGNEAGLEFLEYRD